MVKARILIQGTVQGVGYRAMVKHLATQNNVRGLIRNLDTGGVELFFDGEKSGVERLLKAIDVKGNPKDPFSLNVARMGRRWEGEDGYTPAWREYKRFEIDYGEEKKYSPFERESLESFEIAKLSFSRLEGEVSLLRSDTNKNFQTMEKRYGKISEELVATKEEVKGSMDGVKGSMDGLKGSIDELPKRMTGALLKGIKKPK